MDCHHDHYWSSNNILWLHKSLGHCTYVLSPPPKDKNKLWKIAKIDEALTNLFGSKLGVEKALYYMVSCEELHIFFSVNFCIFFLPEKYATYNGLFHAPKCEDSLNFLIKSLDFYKFPHMYKDA